MKSWNDPHSPYGKRLQFEDREFEAMMDELRDRAGDCSSSKGGVDVDRVLLRSESTEPDYVTLPEDILGRTTFFESGKVKVEVSRVLSNAAENDRVARRRLRTTVAHEIGHIACHRVLFIRDTETFSLFASGSPNASSMDRKPIMCRTRGIGNPGYNGEWWEYQANQCMAALLLPKSFVSKFARSQIATGGFASGDDLFRAGCGLQLVRDTAEEFDVSQTATLFRLQSLGFAPKGPQPKLRLED